MSPSVRFGGCCKGRGSRFHPGWSAALVARFSDELECWLSWDATVGAQWGPALFLVDLFSWVLRRVTFNITTVPSVCGSFFSSLFPHFLPSFRQHRTAITGLAFSPDGNLMFSSCLQGTLALYSFVARKTQVLRVLGKSLGLGLPFFFFFC